MLPVRPCPAPQAAFRPLPLLLSMAAALVTVLHVSACSVPGSGDMLPSPAPNVEPVTAPEHEPDLRAQARSFVQTVAAVEPVAEAECRRMQPRANCDFRIVVDDRPGQGANAFQTLDSSGRPVLAFTLAMIAEVENADQLAFVMAHEAAHHILGHLDRQNRNAMMGAAVLGQLANVVGGGNAEAIRSAQELGAVVGARSYSKDFELEADALGARITVLAGFDPLAGATFFGRIPDPGNRFLGTHPPNAERIAVVRRTVQEMGGAGF